MPVKSLFLSKSKLNFMRKSILNPFTLRKRFVIIAAIMLAMFAAIGLMACSDDNNPTGGNGNPPVNSDSLVLAIDSITVKTTTISSMTEDSIINIDLPIGDSVKMTFTVESNCDSTHNPNVFGQFGNIHFNLLFGNLNNTFILYGRYSTAFVHFHLEMHTFIGDNRYIKVKNIKLYKVKP